MHMPKKGKKYKKVFDKVERTKRYPLEEALELLPNVSYVKFDESVDIAVKLGVNPRHADQMVRGALVLPHGTGKTARILVFAKGDKAKEAEEAGADYVGAEDMVDKIQKEGWLDFDKAISTPDMMGLVGRLGRVLGPRGMMPNPKVGTVTMDVAKAVQEMKAGRVEFRVEKAGIVHAPLGKVSFGTEKIRDNLMSLMDQLLKLKPTTAKGTYVQGITLSTTMGPGIKLDAAAVLAQIAK